MRPQLYVLRPLLRPLALAACAQLSRPRMDYDLLGAIADVTRAYASGGRCALWPHGRCTGMFFPCRQPSALSITNELCPVQRKPRLKIQGAAYQSAPLGYFTKAIAGNPVDGHWCPVGRSGRFGRDLHLFRRTPPAQRDEFFV